MSKLETARRFLDKALPIAGLEFWSVPHHRPADGGHIRPITQRSNLDYVGVAGGRFIAIKEPVTGRRRRSKRGGAWRGWLAAAGIASLFIFWPLGVTLLGVALFAGDSDKHDS